MEPYISFVMTGRNDDYGEDFLHRAECSLNSIIQLADQTETPVEILFLEWNPPADRPTLDHALTLSTTSEYATCRFVRVPASIHQQERGSDEMPLLEYHAKNAGIRRAQGEFVLATNPDIVFNADIFELFSSRSLQPGRYYRIERYDVSATLPSDASVECLLTTCRNNVFCRSDGKRGYDPYGGIVWLSTSFTERIRRQLRLLRFPLSTFASLVTSPHDLRTEFAERGVFGAFRQWTPIVVPEARSDSGPTVTVERPKEFADLHNGPAGDFLLLAADDWERMRGYPELGTSYRIDNYGVALAAAIGLKQALIREPCRIYHQEHDRSDREGRGHINRDRALEDYERLLSGSDRSDIPNRLLNDNDWGLGGYTLEEITFS